MICCTTATGIAQFIIAVRRPGSRLPPSLPMIDALQQLSRDHDAPILEDINILRRQLVDLREASLPPAEFMRALDLIYGVTEKMLEATLPSLCDGSLRVSRKMRQLLRAILSILEMLAQDHLDTLAELYDPTRKAPTRPPVLSLWRVIDLMSSHLLVSYLMAAPVSHDVWEMLNSTYIKSVRLGLENGVATAGMPTIRQLYVRTLLLSCAQPHTFTAAEIAFISAYISTCGVDPGLLSQRPATDLPSLFWIDLQADLPPYPVVRRPILPDAREPRYLLCDDLARRLKKHLEALEGGQKAARMGLPDFADTAVGKGVLRRLLNHWGSPRKRRFPRRRQTVRATLCPGLKNLWEQLQSPNDHPERLSQWMIVNECPEGYAVMHLEGKMRRLYIGDVVALRPDTSGNGGRDQPWQICMVRWARTDNPEHIELGLQILAPQGQAVEVGVTALPDDPPPLQALLLPPVPPVYPSFGLVIASGAAGNRRGKLLVLQDTPDHRLKVTPMRASRLREQTSSIEIFNIVPDVDVPVTPPDGAGQP